VTIEAAITQAMAYVGAVSGILQAPDPPIEQPGEFPFAVGYPGDGTFEGGPAGATTALHNIVIELHVARKDLPTDYSRAIPYVDSIPATLLSNLSSKWGSTISTFARISYRWGEMDYGGQKTLGIQFTVEGVKILT